MPDMHPSAALNLLASALRAAALTALATAAAWAMDGAYSLASQAMAYLLAVVFSAFRFGRRDSSLTALCSVIALNFFFVPPRHTLEVENPDYLVMLGALLLVSLVVSGLTARLKAETAQVRMRERRAQEMHALADTLASADDLAQLMRSGAAALRSIFDRDCRFLVADEAGRLVIEEIKGSIEFDADAARWAFEQQRSIGPSTAYWPELANWYVPLPGPDTALGVVAMSATAGRTPAAAYDLRYLEAFARQVGLALQRSRLAQRARAAALEAKAEFVRNALLASISHDFRTPLAAILGSASTLSAQRELLSDDQQRSLLRAIEDEAKQMTATAENILQLARLSSGTAILRRDWESVEEMVGAVIRRFRGRGEQRIRAQVDAGLPLVHVDAVLIAQVLANLLENAVHHAPPETQIDVSARAHDQAIMLAVQDRGRGLGAADPARLFDKFHRGEGEPAHGGVGLGLAICKAIVEMHGGTISASNRHEGGATFAFNLPFSPQPSPLLESGEPQ
ncbi:MAG: DUF4118 domain-containing protein [Prolixibacteraceae bacterium]|nr:DUF4118 domain-containing protein [Burkholderiales bacterium]